MLMNIGCYYITDDGHFIWVRIKCEVQKCESAKRTSYKMRTKMRTKMRSRLRILYVTTYKLRNKKCEIPIFDDGFNITHTYM